MNARSTMNTVVMLVLGVLVTSFVVYTARADGDEHVGVAPPPPKAVSQEMPELPDIILITVDTLRADRLGAYGYAAGSTPNIDALAASGIVFANATVPLPRTTPGLASLLTGLHPESHGSREVWEPVKVTKGQRLAEVLSEAGYATIGLSANSAAGTRQGLARGFDQFLDQRTIKRKRKRDDADIVTKEALRLVDDIDEDTPVFMWVHYVDPHWRYAPPKKGWKKQPVAKKCRELQKSIKAKEVSLGHMFSNANGIATKAFDDCSALYDAEVSFNDHHIGKLIEGLDERGRWADALKVFTADHGENMGEDGLYFAHGPSLADAALRVPLIVAGPTIPPGRLDGGIAIIEDVMPTLLDLAQIEEDLWPEKIEGASLQWRWNENVEPPLQVPSLAVAEAGGALHPDTTQYVVSGRRRSQYCYNGPRYSMCFEPEDAKKRRGPTRTSPLRPGGGDDEDGEEENDGPEAGDDPEDDEHGDEHGDPDDDSDDDGTEQGDGEEKLDFYDRQADPLMNNPISDVPEDARAQLVDARKRWSPESTRLRAVRDTAYKLVAYPKLEGGYRYALYDLRADPSEATDIKERSPRVFKRMKAALDDFGNTMPTFVARERSDSELDELRALGYVQ